MDSASSSGAATTTPPSSYFATTAEARGSLFARAARLDGAGPARDLADDEFCQILRRPPIGRRDGHADGLEPLAHGRRFHRLVGGLGEALYDLVRRSLGEEALD